MAITDTSLSTPMDFCNMSIVS